MKKSIFILAAIFAATYVVNAQITLEHTFNGTISAPEINQNIFGDYYVQKINNTITVYDAEDYSVVWTLSSPNASDGIYANAYLYSSNIFTTDGKLACVVVVLDENKSDNTRFHLYVYDEDNNILADLGTCWEHEYINFIKLSTGYKLLIEKVSTDHQFTTEIYSLPGNGAVTDISEVSASHRNVRKYLRNEQVLINSNERTYNIQGQEVR